MGREGSTADRVHTIQLAWNVLKEHPIAGVAPPEWNAACQAAGVEFYCKGGPLVGWLQVPVEGGLIGVGLLAALVVPVAQKLQQTLSNAGDARARLLMQCVILSILCACVSNLFDAVFMEEGKILVPVLLGALLGSRHAKTPREDSAACD
jgi:hypothetical protein